MPSNSSEGPPRERRNFHTFQLILHTLCTPPLTPTSTEPSSCTTPLQDRMGFSPFHRPLSHPTPPCTHRHLPGSEPADASSSSISRGGGEAMAVPSLRADTFITCGRTCMRIGKQRGMSWGGQRPRKRKRRQEGWALAAGLARGSLYF